MGRAYALHFGVQQVAGQPRIALGPGALLTAGCNLRVEIATAAAFVNDPANPAPRGSISVMAHLDTGASQTMIAPAIATHLALVQTGVATHTTAGGPTSNPTYAVDITFVGTNLASKPDLNVGSCSLPFDMTRHAANPSDPKNLGMLIGRDVMTTWHVVWDGPTSMVFIYD